MLVHIIGGGPVWPLWLTGTVLFGGEATIVTPAFFSLASTTFFRSSATPF